MVSPWSASLLAGLGAKISGTLDSKPLLLDKPLVRPLTIGVLDYFIHGTDKNCEKRVIAISDKAYSKLLFDGLQQI
jgi:hypothetical protein